VCVCRGCDERDTFHSNHQMKDALLAQFGTGPQVQLWLDNTVSPAPPESDETAYYAQKQPENFVCVGSLIGDAAGDGVRVVCFSPDGSQIATGTANGVIKIWDVAERKELLHLADHLEGILTVNFNPDGTRLVSGSVDTTVRIWDAVGGEEIHAITEGLKVPAVTTLFSVDNDRIIAASHDGVINIWDVANNYSNVLVIRGISHDFTIVQHPSGNSIAAPGPDGLVLIYNTTNGEIMATLDGPIHPLMARSGARGMCYSPDGSKLAVTAMNQHAHVWDTATYTVLFSVEGLGDLHCSTFSSNGRLAFGGIFAFFVVDSDNGQLLETVFTKSRDMVLFKVCYRTASSFVLM
jgi:WD40 repeat protein